MAPQRSPSDSHPLARAAALALLVVALNFWAGKHLGISIGDPGWLAPGMTALSVATLVGGLVLGGERVGALRDRARESAERALHPWLIVLLYVLAILLVLTWSSVEVIGGSPDERAAVTLRPLDRPASVRTSQLGPELRPARFRPVFTGPFGRSYRLDAPGYAPVTFEVFPLAGRTLRLGVDVPPAPSVLFRPPPVALGSLENGGSFRAFLREGGDRRLVAQGAGAASFLVGRDQALPADLEADWRLETEDQPDAGGTLLKWRHPVVLEPRASLAAGASLEAVVYSRAGKPVATAAVKLRSEPLMDVRMSEVHE